MMTASEVLRLAGPVAPADKLRVVVRSEPVGVVLDAAAWDALEGFIQTVLEVPELADRQKDIQIEALWGDRLTHRGAREGQGRRRGRGEV